MPLERSEAVVELGKRLVAQLKIDNHDILSSWMVHHIAELIENVEKSPTDPKAAEACSRAILNFWNHRAVLPENLRPLSSLEPILRTLSALDVDEEKYHFYRPALREASRANVDDASREWLDLAMGLDYSARLLIGYALRSAAEKAVSDSEPWVKLALEAGANQGLESHLVRFTLENEELEDENKGNHSALEKKLIKLEEFVSLTNSLIEDLRAELEAKKA